MILDDDLTSSRYLSEYSANTLMPDAAIILLIISTITTPIIGNSKPNKIIFWGVYSTFLIKG
jgi:hypothetical protein